MMTDMEYMAGELSAVCMSLSAVFRVKCRADSHTDRSILWDKMVTILVDTETVRKRLSVLGFSFVGVADASGLEVDVRQYKETDDDPIVADCTSVLHNSRYQLDDDLCYSMGEEYYQFLKENIGRTFYIYYVYREIETVQYEDGVCKYTDKDSTIHAPCRTVYHPVKKRFYSMCYCGTLEWLHMERKDDYVPTDDTVIVVRR